MLRKNDLNSREIGNILEFLVVASSYRTLQIISTAIPQQKFDV